MILFITILIISQKSVASTSSYVLKGDCEYDFQEPENPIDLLVLIPYVENYRWSSRISEHILDKASREMGKTAISYNIPLTDIYSEEELDSLINIIFTSIKNTPPKAIVLLGSSFFCLVEDINRTYPDIPIMLIGGQDVTGTKEQTIDRLAITEDNGIHVSQLKEKYNITNQITPVYVKEELDLICDMMPDLRTIYYIGSSDQFSRSKQLELSRAIRVHSRKLALRVLSSETMDMDQLLETVLNLDPKTNAVIYSSWNNSQQISNSSISMNRTLNIVEVSSAPAFILRDNGWMDENKLILGGCILDENSYNSHLDMALTQLLEGVPARDIPDYENSTPIVKLNYEALQKFGITKYPHNAIINGKPKSFLQKNKIWLLSFGVAVLSVISILLLLLNQRTRKLAASRKREMRFYEELYNALDRAPIGGSRARLIMDRNGNITDVQIIYENKLMSTIGLDRKFNGNKNKLKERYPDVSSNFIKRVQDAKNNGESQIRFTLSDFESGKHYEIFVMIEHTTTYTFAVDISKRMSLQEQLIKSKNEAEAANMHKTQFIHNMSHELRTPLNAILGFSQLMSLPNEFTTDQERSEYGEYVKNNSNLLMMLIDDILDVANAENGNYQIKKDNFHINELCRTAMKTVEYRVPTGVEYLFDTDVPDDFTIYSDPNRVQQVIINYLTNACKHTVKGTIRLSLSTSERKNKMTLAVTDTGTGVPEDMKEEIFERFTKVDAFVQGTGLGLNICRTIADKLNGTVSLDTTYNGGARFLFTIPI